MPRCCTDVAPEAEPPLLILNGTNFLEWQLQLHDALKREALEFFTITATGARQLCSPSAVLSSAATSWRSLKASLIINNRVSPYLLLRVPSDDHLDAAKLLDNLETLCGPFRLLDLPLELRQRIYTEMFPEMDPCGERDLLRLDEEGYASAEPLPALSQVSRQLHHEFLELYLGTSKMCLCIDDDWESPCGPGTNWSEAFESLVRDWAEHSARLYSRFLRNVVVRLPGPEIGHHFYSFHLQFSSVRGLEVSSLDLKSEEMWDQEDPWNELVKDSWIEDRLDHLEIVKDHVSKIEADRKVLGLQGESIIMALMQRKDIQGQDIWIATD